MKVLFISTNNFGSTGISTFIINTTKLLAKQKNYKIDILTPNSVDSNIKDSLKKYNVDFYSVLNRNSRPIVYYKNLKKFLIQKKYDVVHVNGSSTIMFIELMAAYFAGVKVRVAHSHNTVTEHPLLNKIFRIPFEIFVNRRIACNEAAGRWLFKTRKFSILRNGIQTKKFEYNPTIRKNIRTQLGFQKDDVVLGHVGSFNYQKNQEFLINILNNLDQRYKLLLIGSGETFQKIKNKANNLNLADRVTFLGTVNNVNEYLSAMDIFLLPSRFEGQPFVVIEASANGLPIIVSNAVSREINLTNNVDFITLNVDKWIQSLDSFISTNRKRGSTYNINKLNDLGYDISAIRRNLLSIYEDKDRNSNG